MYGRVLVFIVCVVYCAVPSVCVCLFLVLFCHRPHHLPEPDSTAAITTYLWAFGPNILSALHMNALTHGLLLL